MKRAPSYVRCLLQCARHAGIDTYIARARGFQKLRWGTHSRRFVGASSRDPPPAVLIGRPRADRRDLSELPGVRMTGDRRAKWGNRCLSGRWGRSRLIPRWTLSLNRDSAPGVSAACVASRDRADAGGSNRQTPTPTPRFALRAPWVVRGRRAPSALSRAAFPAAAALPGVSRCCRALPCSELPSTPSYSRQCQKS
jgi:hypothetical protein